MVVGKDVILIVCDKLSKMAYFVMMTEETSSEEVGGEICRTICSWRSSVKDVVKLKLLAFMRIHLVVNVNRVVIYRELMKEQKVKKPKLVEVNRVEEWKAEKILNKRKVWEIKKYLVYWKEFTIGNNMWERKKDLENIKKAVAEFKERISAKVRWQKEVKRNKNLEKI